MKILRSLAALLLIGTACVYSQTPPNHTAFRASLVKFQKQSVDWRKTLDAVKVEELPVSYAEGKAIDQDNGLALQNLDLASKLTTRILSGGHLADEIDLMLTELEFGRELESIENLLLEVPEAGAGGVKVHNWLDALTALGSGPVNTLHLEIYEYVTLRSDEIEKKNCSTGQSGAY